MKQTRTITIQFEVEDSILANDGCYSCEGGEAQLFYDIFLQNAMAGLLKKIVLAKEDKYLQEKLSKFQDTVMSCNILTVK